MDIQQSMSRADAIVQGALNIPLDQLHGDGVALLSGLAVISVALTGYKTMFDQHGNLRALGARFVVMALFIGVLSWLVNDGYTQVFVEGVDKTFVAIADKLMPGAGSGDQMVSASEIFMKVYNSISAGIGHLYQDAGPLDVIKLTATNLPALVTMIMSMVIIIFSMIAYMSLQTISMMLIKLALILGPIFLPWALFKNTSFLTAGWIRFFLSASLYKVLGAGLLSIALKIVQGLGGMISPENGFIDTFFASIAIAGAVMAIAGLIVMIPRLSQQMVSAGVPKIGL